MTFFDIWRQCYQPLSYEASTSWSATFSIFFSVVVMEKWVSYQCWFLRGEFKGQRTFWLSEKTCILATLIYWLLASLPKFWLKGEIKRSSEASKSPWLTKTYTFLVEVQGSLRVRERNCLPRNRTKPSHITTNYLHRFPCGRGFFSGFHYGLFHA